MNIYITEIEGAPPKDQAPVMICSEIIGTEKRIYIRIYQGLLFLILKDHVLDPKIYPMCEMKVFHHLSTKDKEYSATEVQNFDILRVDNLREKIDIIDLKLNFNEPTDSRLSTLDLPDVTLRMATRVSLLQKEVLKFEAPGQKTVFYINHNGSIIEQNSNIRGS